MAVENLKLVKHTELHRSAEEIYQVYVVPSSDKSVMLDTTLIRGMEQYLQGTHGLQAFFEAQKRAYKNLEEKYYRKFVLSEEYLMFVCQSEAELDDLRAQRRDEDDSDNEDDDDDDEVKLVKFTIMWCLKIMISSRCILKIYFSQLSSYNTSTRLSISGVIHSAFSIFDSLPLVQLRYVQS